VCNNGLLNVLTVYTPHSGKLEEEKDSFWNDVFHLVSCIRQNEMVVLDGDMNGHVGSSNVGYDGTHGGFGVKIGMQMHSVCRWAKLSHLQLLWNLGKPSKIRPTVSPRR